MLAPNAADLAAAAAEIALVPAKEAGHLLETSVGAVKLPTVPVRHPGLSKETTRLLEDTLNPAAKAASTQVPSAATATAERQEAIPHEGAPALAAVVVVVAAVAEVTAAVAIGKAKCGKFQTEREI
jgi:hypothetical protein